MKPAIVLRPPRADVEASGVPNVALSTVVTDPDRRIVLFDARGVPLVRPIGFRPATRKDGPR